MLTFSRPFTVCINFIEAVGFEEIHEKKNGSVEKRERMGYCPFLVLYRDREFWPFVITKKSLSRQRFLVLGRDRKFTKFGELDSQNLGYLRFFK